jgi:hypothetical protein
MATVQLHAPKKYVRQILDHLNKIIHKVGQSIKDTINWVFGPVLRLIGPEPQPLPSALTTFASIFAFFVFFGFLAASSRWPTENKRITMNIIVGTSVLTIMGLCVCDYSAWVRTRDGQGESNYDLLQNSELMELPGKSKMKYTRNLANTVLSLTLSMVVLLLVYDFKWHEALNHIVLETTEEPMVRDWHREHNHLATS